MVDVWLPYGKSEVCVRIPTRNYLGELKPRTMPSVSDLNAEVERALGEPLGEKRLSQIVNSDSRIVIIVDSERPTHIQCIVSGLLAELDSVGVKNENTTVVASSSNGEELSQENWIKLLGDEIVQRIRHVTHFPESPDLEHVGSTNQGTKVFLNNAVFEADVKVVLSEVRFHSFAGYSGADDDLLRVCGQETIRHNHSLLASPNAKAGTSIGNPVFEDTLEIARFAKLDFTLNFVCDAKGEVMKVFAGNLEEVSNEAFKLVDETYRLSVDRRADIAVFAAGGNPHDATLFEACEFLENASDIVKRGGVIILLAECSEGHGNLTFYDWMTRLDDLKAAEKEVKRNYTYGGERAYSLLRVLQNHSVILVSSMPDYYAASVFKLKTTRAVNDALTEALNMTDKNGKIWAIPYGHSALVEYRVPQEQQVEIVNA